MAVPVGQPPITLQQTRPDAADQANALARAGVLQLVQAYRGGGNEALGEYRDKQHPARVADQFQTMIGRASTLPDVLPELRRYLLEYPKADLAGADSFFYWEKVSFGLKPTIRVNHAVIYRGRSQGRSRPCAPSPSPASRRRERPRRRNATWAALP